MRHTTARRRALFLGLAALALVFAAGCQAPHHYDRGQSIQTSIDVIFGDPRQDLRDLGDHFGAIFERAGRDARELPNSVSEFAAFFY